jgi:hypothetical protein
MEESSGSEKSALSPRFRCKRKRTGVPSWSWKLPGIDMCEAAVQPLEGEMALAVALPFINLAP